MRLSEAIALGRVLCIPMPYQQDDQQGGGCALGMAARAVGAQANFRFPDGHLTYDAGTAFWTEMQTPINGCPICNYDLLVLGHAIAHIFNEHVFGDKQWTLDQLIDWVRSVEPPELATLPSAEDLDAVAQEQSIAERTS